MANRKPTPSGRSTKPMRSPPHAHSGEQTLCSEKIGALPILNHFIKNLRLEEFLTAFLPPDDKRTKIPHSKTVLVLLRNLLICREPLYGLGDWAAGYVPELLGLNQEEWASFGDDAAGHALGAVFRGEVPALVAAVAGHAIRRFRLAVDEFHNDSTTITFHGSYADAAEEGTRSGRQTLAITWGHNKDHRPDLKQLLFILTLNADGGVPMHFRAASGNTPDDPTHIDTWKLVSQLAGRKDFLYVADCKLASRENMLFIAGEGGRFVTVLPRTRAEDGRFRKSLVEGKVTWRLIHERTEEHDGQAKVIDRISVAEPPTESEEGFRLLWYHSTRKAELDAEARRDRLRRALRELGELRERLASPRSRFHSREKAAEAARAILTSREVNDWIAVSIEERTVEHYRQERPGRPGKDTKYRKELSTRCDMSWRLDEAKIAEDSRCDGVFPLITNDRQLSEKEILMVYKRQPVIEKRFSQLKTDFQVAPVYLKDVGRIQGLLCVYFLALLTEAILERHLRRAMEREQLKSLPLYPEDRLCRRPTARRVIDLFDNIYRHTISGDGQSPTVFVTELSDLQRQILKLLDIPATDYQA